MNLVFHQAALGDFVLALPTLRRLIGPTTLVVPWSHGRIAARLFPQARVLDAELFEFTRLWAQGGPTTVSPAIAEAFEQTQRVVSFIAPQESDWTQNIARLTAAPVACVQPRPEASWHLPLHNWHAQQLARQHVALKPESTDTRFGQPLIQPTTSPPRRFILHPGSGGVGKCWPIERFLQVAHALKANDDQTTFLLGPAELERGLAESLLQQAPDLQATALHDADELCFALSNATHYLGNDAGPTHVAAQLGLHTTALFGPSDPRVWAPIGPRVQTVAPESPRFITWLDVETVLQDLGVN